VSHLESGLRMHSTLVLGCSAFAEIFSEGIHTLFVKPTLSDQAKAPKNRVCLPMEGRFCETK